MMVQGGLADSAEFLRTNMMKGPGERHNVRNINSNTSCGRRPASSRPHRDGRVGIEVNQLHPSQSNTGQSDDTIYRKAIEKRGSSSSEELDMSINERAVQRSIVAIDNIVHLNLSDDSEGDAWPWQQRVDQHSRARADCEEDLTPDQRAQQKTDRLIRAAEASKAQVLSAPGKVKDFTDRDYVHSMLVDEEYLLVGSHIDSLVMEKIGAGEYIDFKKLIPRERGDDDDEEKIEIQNQEGRPIFAPVDNFVQITSFARWEQAFRVFSNVYTRYHPKQASELIQYNHIIHSLSLTYAWHNVYAYDKDFW